MSTSFYRFYFRRLLSRHTFIIEVSTSSLECSFPWLQLFVVDIMPEYEITSSHIETPPPTPRCRNHLASREWAGSLLASLLDVACHDDFSTFSFAAPCFGVVVGGRLSNKDIYIYIEDFTLARPMTVATDFEARCTRVTS